MNGSTADLGKAIISAYYNKLNEWSSLPEPTLPEDALPASFSIAKDMLCIEEDWQGFAALIQTLQTDYLPQDLFEASGTGTLPPGQLPSLKQRENHPWTLPQTADRPFVFPADFEEHPAQNNISDNTDLSLYTGGGFNFPEIGEFSSSSIENKALLFEFPGYPFEAFTNDIAKGSEKEIPAMPRENILNPAQNQHSLDPDGPDVIPQGVSMQKTELHDLQDYPASIWTSPLQNLGDFASQITYPVSRGDQHIPISGSTQPFENNANPSSLYLRRPTATGLNTQTNESHPSTTNPFATPGLFFTIPPAPDPAESMSQKGEIADLQPENQPFQSSVPPPAILPDTDELLEALTDRIRRDFRRYYP